MKKKFIIDGKIVIEKNGQLVIDLLCEDDYCNIDFKVGDKIQIKGTFRIWDED